MAKTRRAIPFDCILFSHAGTESLQAQPGKTNVNLLMACLIQQQKLEMIAPIRPQGQPCDAPNSLQLPPLFRKLDHPPKRRLKWVDDRHGKALLAECG